MNIAEVNKIIKLNKDFYHKTSVSFDKSRKYYWQGWDNILPEIKKLRKTKKIRVLDIACGNGRFVNFLTDRIGSDFYYLGIDTNEYFLDIAKNNTHIHDFKNIDAIKNISDLSKNWDLIVCFGFTHHLPDENTRKTWFSNLNQLLNPKGMLVLTFWNINNINYKEIINKQSEKDFFLGWKEEKIPRSYHLYDEKEINEIIIDYKKAGLLNLVKDFFSDGKDNKSNRYLVFQKNN